MASQNTENNRVWEIYEHDTLVFELRQGTKTWEIDRDSFQTEQEFRAAVENELASLEVMGERLGRAFTAVPVRIEVSPGRFQTLAWRFQDAFVPAARFKEPEVEPEEVAAV